MIKGAVTNRKDVGIILNKSVGEFDEMIAGKRTFLPMRRCPHLNTPFKVYIHCNKEIVGVVTCTKVDYKDSNKQPGLHIQDVKMFIPPKDLDYLHTFYGTAKWENGYPVPAEKEMKHPVNWYYIIHNLEANDVKKA